MTLCGEHCMLLVVVIELNIRLSSAGCSFQEVIASQFGMPVVKKRIAVKMANSRGWNILVCLSMDLILIRVKDIFHTNVTLTLSLSPSFS